MIFVTGKEGQVARALTECAAVRSVPLVAYGRADCDLLAPKAAAEFIRAQKPTALINAAAYTAVDAAESDEATATALNADAPAMLAALAADMAIPFLHISTDYVFDGTKDGSYVEDDTPNPTGAYGRSKLAGEQRVMAANPNAVILRTAWVYSPFGKNFLKTMLSLSARPELGIVADQHGNPTYALDIAAGLLDIIAALGGEQASGIHKKGGVYHMAGTGTTTWHGFAAHIFDTAASFGGRKPALKPLTTAEYPTPAKRPANSRLDCTKLEKTFSVRLPDWRDSTKACVKRLSESGTLS